MLKLITRGALCLIISVNFLSAALAQDIFVLEDGNAVLIKTSLTPGVRTVLKSSLGRVGGIAVHSTSGDIYYTTNSTSATIGAIKRVNSDGTNETTVASGLAFPTGIALLETTNELYYVQKESTPTIYMVATDGLSAPVRIMSGVAGQGPIDLDVDAANSLVYWTDERGPSVRRSNLDGSSPVTVSNVISGDISGIAVDPANSRVFWLDQIGTEVSFASTSGPFPVNGSTSLSDPSIGLGGLTVDETVSPVRLYWTNASNSKVSTAPHQGTATSLLVSTNGVAGPIDIDLAHIVPSPTPTSTPTQTETPIFTSTPVPTATPVSLILSPGITIDDPPDVSVTARTAKLVFQNFTQAINTDSISGALNYLPELLEANAALTIRYDVHVTASKKRESQKLLSKRNELTLTRLAPGNYSVNYSAGAYTKKSKTQIQKAAAQGKTGFTDKYKKVFSTNFSPSAAFAIQ
jgi:hypothetical protein